MKTSDGAAWECSLSRRDVRWVYAALWAGNLFFLATNLLMAAGWHPPLNTIARLLDLDRPGSLGKWWMSAQLLLLSITAAMMMRSGRRASGGAQRMERYGWSLFALIMLAMSGESIARMKQDLEGAARNLLPTGDLAGFELNWAELFAPLIIAVGIFLVAFARRVLGGVPRARKLALWGVAAWVASIVLEVVECSLLYGRSVALQVRAFEPTVEQTLQLAGATLLLMALAELGFAGTASRAKAKGGR